MANKIQIRRDTAYNWSDVNPVLVEGEPGLETDTGKFKFGNGANNWVDLPYSNFEETVYNDFHVEGDTYLGNTTVTGTFTFNGNTQYIQAENSVYTDNLLEIHNPGGNIANTWTSNDTKDIGIRMHYYNGGDKNAALYMDNGDWLLKWVVDGTEDNQGQFNHSGFGDFQANTVYANIVSTTVVSNGVDLNNYTQSAFDKANTGINNAASASAYANTGINNAASASVYANTGINNAASASVYANTGINNAASASAYANTGINNAASASAYANTGIINSGNAFNKANSANVLAQAAFNAANSVSLYANTGINNAASASLYANTAINNAAAAFNKANSANVLAQAAFNSANTAAANTVYLDGVNDGQNTSITSVTNNAAAAFTKANTASANTIIIQGVDNTQNTNITFVTNNAAAAFTKANSATTLAQAAFDKANTTTQSNTFTNITVSNTATFNGLTQIQQLDTPYTSKTNASGTVTHDCSSGQLFYHTSISSSFTPNFTNLGLSSGYVTEVKLYLVQGSSSRSVTSMQIAGSTKTINWYNATNPTYSSNAVDVVTFTILLVNTTYTVFGKVEKYDSVSAGGGGG